MVDTVVIGGDIELINVIDGEINLATAMDGECGIFYEVSAREYPDYEGPYSVTPSDVVQTLETKDTVMTQNVTIDPIPPNYGLITWDGVTLTVS